MSEWIEVSIKNSYVEIEDRWQVYYNLNTGEYKVAIFHEDNHFLDEIIFDEVGFKYEWGLENEFIRRN